MSVETLQQAPAAMGTASRQMNPTQGRSPGVLALRIPEQDLVALEDLATECAALAARQLTPFRRTFLMAAGMNQLRALITPAMMADVMELQGSPLGFRTDKDREGGYDLNSVKEAAIEATLRGLRLVGNEINIIAGRCYAAKDGLRRLVREWPGLTDLAIRLQVPHQQEGFTVVPAKATWKLDGRDCCLDATGPNAIPVRVNKDAIVDATLGKAKRKLYALIYDCLTGAEQKLIEPEEPEDTIDVQPTVSASDPSEQDELIADYALHIGQANETRGVSAVARQAGQDQRLSPESRQRVIVLCMERTSQLKTSRGPTQ
jgi:hypothetical protein